MLHLLHVPGGNSCEHICMYSATHQPRAFLWLFMPHVCLPGVIFLLIILKVFLSGRTASGTSIVVVAVGGGSCCRQ